MPNWSAGGLTLAFERQNMYFKITKSFLQSFSKEHILASFKLGADSQKKTKKKLIEEIIEKNTSHPEVGSVDPWYFICPFCRVEGKLLTASTNSGTPKFCTRCGKTAPLNALEKSLQNTDALLVLASKMNLKSEQDTKAVLVEQGLVTVITGLEVFLRQTYSLIYDLHHVVYGKSLYSDIYPKTRSDFLNLGAATSQIRKLTSFNLKKEISEDRYKFLSTMYSARHIIVHNSSQKDKEFINQTSAPDSDLGKPLKLTIPEVRRAKSIAFEITKKLDSKLREVILSYQKQKKIIEIKLKK